MWEKTMDRMQKVFNTIKDRKSCGTEKKCWGENILSEIVKDLVRESVGE
jgi:hypothetical protein